MSEVRVYRSKSTRWLAATLSFIFLLVVLAGAAGLGGGSKKSSSITAVSAAVMAAAVLGLVWSLLGFAQMGVTSSDEGILIRNWFRRIAIPWCDIKEFAFGNRVANLSIREGLSSPVLQTYVVTKDGRHYVMSGLAATRINRSTSKRHVQTLLDRLEDERVGHLRGARDQA